MALAAIALLSTIAATSPTRPPLELVSALMRDGQVAACAKEAGKPAPAYVAQAFELRRVRLRSGEQMTVAVGTDGCTSRGQSNRIMIFERTSGGYRRVLDDVTMSDAFDVSEDGTVVLPTHETIVTIFEAAFEWNGSSYVFSRARSHVYDVPLGQRRPYEVPVRFASGAFATTLSGTTALNFGEDYVFEARAGQRLTLELTRHRGHHPAIFLSYGDREVAQLDAERWSGKLSRGGSYKLAVFGSGENDSTSVSTYTIRLTIR